MVYNFKTWQEISPFTPVQENTTYTIKDSLGRTIFTGMTPYQSTFENLQEILCQYVGPAAFNQPSLNTELYEDPNLYQTFTVHKDTSEDFDTINLQYDYSYRTGTDLLGVLSDPVVPILDPRQLFPYTVFSSVLNRVVTATITQTEEGGEVSDQYTWSIQKGRNTTIWKKLDQITYPGEFDLSFSDDFFIWAQELNPYYQGYLQIDGKTYVIAQTCRQYCLYYLNPMGGWDWLLVDGKVMQSESYKTYQYRRKLYSDNYHQNYIYRREISDAWELNTHRLTDLQATKMHNLFSSNNVWLHNLVDNSIVPVNITNKTFEYKTAFNNNRKLVAYTINVVRANENVKLN